MIKHAYGLRGLLSAVIIIVLSAGAAAAAGPSQNAEDGLATAAEQAGKTVPVAAQAEPEGGDEAGTSEEQPEPAPAADPQASEHCATDPATLDEAALAELNHGAIVCWAAHQETPADAKNHGEFVSTYAKDNRGHQEAAVAGAQQRGASGEHGKPEGAGSH